MVEQLDNSLSQGLENGAIDENSEQGTSQGTTPDTQTNEGIDQNNTQSVSGDESNSEEGGNASAQSEDEGGTKADTTYSFLGNEYKKEEVEELISQGRKYNAEAKEILSTLELLATNSLGADGNAFSDAKDFVLALKESADTELKNKCLEDAGGNQDIADELYNSRIADREKNYSDLLERRAQELKDEEKTQTERLATEFETLRQEFPEIKEFNDLSDEVKSLAHERKCSLLEAKLLVDVRAQRALESARRAKEQSAGSQKSDIKTQSPAWEKEMMAGLYAGT